MQDAWDDAVWNWAATVFLFPHGHESERVTVHWVKKTVPGRVTGSMIHWVFFQLSFLCQVGVHTPDWIIFRFFVIRYSNTTQCHITLWSSGHPYGNRVIHSILPVPPHLHFQKKPKLKLLLSTEKDSETGEFITSWSHQMMDHQFHFQSIAQLYAKVQDKLYRYLPNSIFA
jgi:hypothetical protein